MAERTQGTTQEPGKTSAADRLSDPRDQARELGAQVQERAQEMGTQVRDWAQEKGSQIKEGAQEVGTQVRDWAQEKGSQIKEGVQEAMQQVGASASQLADLGQTTMEELGESLEDRIRNKPLQSVLIAAGVGMLIGLLWKK